MIAPNEQPFRNPLGLTYDNGDYAGAMQQAMALADWDDFADRRSESRRSGGCSGIAVANYIETTSGFPRERAEPRVDPGGKISN